MSEHVYEIGGKARLRIDVDENIDDVKIYRTDATNSPTEVLIVHYDPRSALLRIFPKEGQDSGSGPAYTKINEIQIDTLASPWDPEYPVEENDYGMVIVGLPHGLGNNPKYGLTLPKAYRRLIRQIEARTECTVLRLDESNLPHIEGTVFHLPLETFTDFIDNVDLHSDRARNVASRINDSLAANLLHSALGEDAIEPGRGRLPIIQKMTDAVLGKVELDGNELADSVKLISKESRRIARSQPESFGKLQKEINQVSLEELTVKLTESLNSKSDQRNESKWQELFGDNPFALQQIFFCPIGQVRKQVHVKPPNSSGLGARIVDFLLANTVTRAAILVEIKTPATKLMSERPYRGADIFSPASELSGAIAQLQAQIESIRSDRPAFLEISDPLRELEIKNPRGALVVGTTSSLNEYQRSSFDRFRNSLHGIEIVTFDEVVERLRSLCDILSDADNRDKDIIS